jgi:hypothetical protein
VTTYPCILPYFLPTILASSASQSGHAFGMPRVSPLDAGLLDTYARALVATGYGRGEGDSGSPPHSHQPEAR